MYPPTYTQTSDLDNYNKLNLLLSLKIRQNKTVDNSNTLKEHRLIPIQSTVAVHREDD